jgi:hypothetical protein
MSDNEQPMKFEEEEKVGDGEAEIVDENVYNQ